MEVTNTNLQNLITCLEEYLADSLTTAEPMAQTTRNREEVSIDTVHCMIQRQTSIATWF